MKLIRFLNKKNPDPNKNNMEPTFNAICDYKGLCSLYEIERFLHRIEDIVGLPEEHFSRLYKTPIRLLSCRIQHTPTIEAPSARLLDAKLSQVLAGMKYRETLIMPLGAAPEDINLKKDIWRYATFFSLLMAQLGPALTTFKTNITTTNQCWNIFGNIPEPGTPVSYQIDKPDDPASSLLLAPLLFPPASIQWLRQDANAFSDALAVIQSPDHNSLIGKVLRKSLNIEDDLIVSTDKKSVGKDRPIKTTSTNEHGQLFFDWLREHHANGFRNSPIVHDVFDDAIAFLAPEIFITYGKSFNLDWKTVKNSFNKLKYHRVSLSSEGEKQDLFKPLDKKGRWLLIDPFRFEIDAPKELETPDLRNWLIQCINKNGIENTQKDPQYFNNKNQIYLVIPGLFKHFSDTFFLDVEHTLAQFLTLNIHLKNGDSPFFNIPIGNKILKTLKIPESELTP
ncbi:MAG: TraI domain-containing protein [Gammaproteobacteria bacterium]|nr:TraI domain-containing protein [Gammaproteobacteria bacterium]